MLFRSVYTKWHNGGVDERTLTGDALAEAMFGPLRTPQGPSSVKGTPLTQRPRLAWRNSVPDWVRKVGKLALMPAIAWAVVWGVNHYVAQTFTIPSASMATTLQVGDRVLVTQLDRTNIARGDIVVFTDPSDWLDSASSVTSTKIELGGVAKFLIAARLADAPRDDYLIKRVIGIGGDRVAADGTGTVTVNGTVLDETYLDADMAGSDMAFDVTVPDGHLWVMGDNRTNSADSRYNQDDEHHGMVPLEEVFGTAVATLLPTEHAGRLDSGTKALSAVK